MKRAFAAAILATAALAATPAAATIPAYKILCQEPGTSGTQWLEAYESAPGTMEVWFGLHAYIKMFEPLTRGTPIGPDDVIRARIRPLSMDMEYHTAGNRGFVTMATDDFARVFNTIPGQPVTTINNFACTVDVLRAKARLLPFDPHRPMP